MEANQKEAQECHRRIAEQANTINEKSKAITALERLDNASKNRMLQEREASKEASQEEQRAGRELLSRWTQEKDEMQREIEFQKKMTATMKVEVKTMENQSQNEGQALRNEIQHLKQTVTKLESELQDAKTINYRFVLTVIHLTPLTLCPNNPHITITLTWLLISYYLVSCCDSYQVTLVNLLCTYLILVTW